MTSDDAQQLIQTSVDHLHEQGVLDEHVAVTADTALLGFDSIINVFDSMGFITLIAELEDQLASATGTDVPLVLEEVRQYQGDGSTGLTVGVLADYIQHVTTA